MFIDIHAHAYRKPVPFVVRFCTAEEFQDRLMFGTDMVMPDMKVELPELMLRWRSEGKISETVFQKIA